MTGRHHHKVRDSVAAALDGLESGMTVMVGGFGLCGNAEALIRGVIDKGVKDLTLVSNNAGNLGKGLAQWLRAGIIAAATAAGGEGEGGDEKGNLGAAVHVRSSVGGVSVCCRKRAVRTPRATP